MAKRIFTSFAIEDKVLRDFLIKQAKDNRSPFELTDMSVKQPWDSAWKTNCRSRIRGCNGVIAIITMNTKKADGQLWEVQCAYDEGIPVYPIFGHSDASKRPQTLPAPLGGKRVYNWSWPNIKSFIDRL